MSFVIDDAPVLARATSAAAGDDLAALAARMAAFRLVGLTATAMIGRLERLLTALDAVPLGDWVRWERGATLYGHLRRGPLPQPAPPHLWPYRHCLNAWLHQGYAHAVRCRRAYLDLDRAGRAAAAAHWGRLHEGGQSFIGLWAWGWPEACMVALDKRAVTLRVEHHYGQKGDR